MATYNTLKRGSTGADVKKLQQSLISKGYDLGETGADGDYGNLTEAAVRKYQEDNKLTVDGLAGDETQGSIFAVPKTGNQTASPSAQAPKQTTSNAAPPKTQTTPAADTPTYDPAVDAAYQSALSTLMQVQQTMPTYKDSFSSQLQDVYNKIVNRDKFSYDVNSDALYQQMKDQYIAQGKLAMADTMGQAAAMNGGYGSSYAQSVGQQAYQGYMQQLNDVVPELYDRALAQYNQEGQDMLNQYAMLGDMADDEYAKYQNELNDYYTRLSMAREDTDKAYNRGYQASRDEVADDRYDAEVNRADKNEAYNKIVSLVGTGYSPTDAELEAAGMTREQFDAYVSQHNKEEEKANQPNAYNKVMSFIGTGYTPTDKELAMAGLSRDQYEAMSTPTTSGAVKSWLYTGARDAQDNLIYENNLGERKTFGAGVNPYTGTKHPDALGEGNAFSNGYQPNNIGGTKLVNSGMSTNITGKNQTIWEANGKYWIWRGDLNQYIEVDLSDLD